MIIIDNKSTKGRTENTEDIKICTYISERRFIIHKLLTNIPDIESNIAIPRNKYKSNKKK